MSTDLVVPPILLDVRDGHFGEALDATPENAAAVKLAIQEKRQVLRDAEQMCNEVLLDEMHRHGAKSLNVGGLKVERRVSVEYQWDIDILRELQQLGLPEARWNDLVTETVDYKVSQTVAKQLASANEKYAMVIEAARRTVGKPAYVRVT